MRNPRKSDLRDRFLDWQCRIRQIAMRLDGGRPSPGMRPRVLDGSGRELAALTVLLIPKRPEESTAFFRFQVMKTSDPRDLYERGLTYLQADYFQDFESFSDRLVAILPQDSPVAAQLIEDGKCVLAFEQSGKNYTLPCKTRVLKTGEAARDAALWHNRLFNPALPETVHVIAFEPDWASAKSL
ncbi:MAG: hypothetical protein FJX44_10425 [Alphaproteobacteria bacterium]|nr:hypothetical protein [Alphaproteobacteria bacterium]